MPDRRLYHDIQELIQQGRSGALCTVIRERGSVPRHVGAKMLVHADGSIAGTIGGGAMESRVIQAALESVESGAARVVEYALVDMEAGDPGVCGGEVEVFVEPITPQPTLLVIGGGHVGRALVHLGRWLGFRVALSDDRADFCTPQAVPGADEHVPGGIEQLLDGFRFHAATYIVLATRGVPIDLALLPRLLEQPHAYLGVIGSRRRWATAVEELAAGGVSREQLARVHAPMGLELNAETPEEIAVSILAEVIMLRRGGTGNAMKMGPQAFERAAG